MREPDDDRLGPLAQTLLAASRVVDLRDDAAELGALIKAIRRPFPASLPTDPDEREFALLILALRARDQARRLLALVVDGI